MYQTNERRRYMKKVLCFCILFGLVLSVLTGCMTVGRRFPVDPIHRLQIGKTKKEDISLMFGQPWRTGIEDGKKTWTYGHYRYSLFGETKTADLVLRFNDNDVLISYTFNSSDPNDVGL